MLHSGSPNITCTAFPLNMATPKMKLRVVEISGADSHIKRLADLGLVKDACVMVANAGTWGVVLQLNGASRLAVDARLAGEVWVEEAAA